MEARLFISILCSIFMVIIAPCPYPPSFRRNLLGNSPSRGSVHRINLLPARSLQLPFRRYPTLSTGIIRGQPGGVGLNEMIEAMKRRAEDAKNVVQRQLSNSAWSSVGSGSRFPHLLTGNFRPARIVPRIQIPITIKELPAEQNHPDNPSPPSEPQPDGSISSINPVPIQTNLEEAKEPFNNEENEQELKGPKTLAEEKPELYSVDENVKLVREFSSDMTLKGKFKIGEIIFYLLTKKIKDLDTADKAAIGYTINERMKKDPNLTEAYKKCSENSNNQENPDERPPHYICQLLSPSFSISQFEAASQSENNSLMPNSSQRPPIPFFTRNLPFQNLFQTNDNENVTHPPFRNIQTFHPNHHLIPPPPITRILQFSTPQFRSASFPSRRWSFH